MGLWTRFRKWFEDINKIDVMSLTWNVWCGIFRDTDHPCGERAVCLMRYSNQHGFAEAIFLCDGHHPDKNSWTRRHFEIKGCRVILIEELPKGYRPDPPNIAPP
ncbi:MAG: hypothetical protein HYT14_00220 [Candidatus Liptonbacteria bacterium]|nr:hypothetical protein [Candidatus Liptonbacteria bacterium]